MSDKKPLEKWIGEVVGELHVNGIEHREVAKEMGVTAEYVSMTLNGKRTAKGMEERFKEAIRAILSRRQEANK